MENRSGSERIRENLEKSLKNAENRKNLRNPGKIEENQGILGKIEEIRENRGGIVTFVSVNAGARSLDFFANHVRFFRVASDWTTMDLSIMMDLKLSFLIARLNASAELPNASA